VRQSPTGSVAAGLRASLAELLVTAISMLEFASLMVAGGDTLAAVNVTAFGSIVATR
jgi:hypothetical protein